MKTSLIPIIALLLWLDFEVYDTQSLVVWFLYFADGIVHDIKWYFYTV